MKNPLHSSDFVSMDLPPTVLSITSTPIVCVVLTCKGINWVLLMPAFWSASFEQREPASNPQTPSPKSHFWITLFTDIEDVSSSSLCVQCVIRLFLLLKCSKNTPVNVEENCPSLSFPYKHVRTKHHTLHNYFRDNYRCLISSQFKQLLTHMAYV